MKEIPKYCGCFACGDKNEHGIRARFYDDGGRVVSSMVALKQFEGYHRICHGGIAATMLDEVMVKAILARDVYAMTVEMTVRYHRLIETGQKLQFIGEIERHRGRLYFTKGEARTDDGELVAEATGKYLEVKDDLKPALMRLTDD